MALATRTATTVWAGTTGRGSGELLVGSDAFPAQPLSYATRAGEANGQTSSEELLAGAHSSCVAMSVTAALTTARYQPGHVRVDATCELDRDRDGGFRITRMTLRVSATVPGIEPADFDRIVDEATLSCPGVARPARQRRDRPRPAPGVIVLPARRARRGLRRQLYARASTGSAVSERGGRHRGDGLVLDAGSAADPDRAHDLVALAQRDPGHGRQVLVSAVGQAGQHRSGRAVGAVVLGVHDDLPAVRGKGQPVEHHRQARHRGGPRCPRGCLGDVHGRDHAHDPSSIDLDGPDGPTVLGLRVQGVAVRTDQGPAAARCGDSVFMTTPNAGRVTLAPSAADLAQFWDLSLAMMASATTTGTCDTRSYVLSGCAGWRASR